MKIWVNGVALVTIFIGSLVSIGYYLGFQYKIPQYVSYVIEKNINLSDYERELSMSLSFENEFINLENEPIGKLNNSVLVIHDSKSKEGNSLSYSLTSQGEVFQGEQVYSNNNLIVKSPMYQRYVSFYDTPYVKGDVGDLSYVKESLKNFVEATSSVATLHKDVGGNEKGIKTLRIKGENIAIKKVLEDVSRRGEIGIPYQSILLNNQRITNKLLKEQKNDGEIKKEYEQNTVSMKDRISSILEESTISNSEIEIKITKKAIVKGLTATIQMVYKNPITKEAIPFTLYFDLNTWNVGKTQIKEIETDPINSIPYNRMTDDVNYFDDENIEKEVNASKDKEHAKEGFVEPSQQGLVENNSTLEAIGDDFIPVMPDKK